MTERRRMFFSGHVQGVGFRYTAIRIARQYPVSGWVRNLPDGRVELLIEGEVGVIDATLEEIRAAMRGLIRGEQTCREDAVGDMTGFSLRG